MDEKSYEYILIYYIEYVRIKDCKYVKINILNPLGAIQKWGHQKKCQVLDPSPPMSSLVNFFNIPPPLRHQANSDKLFLDQRP